MGCACKNKALNRTRVTKVNRTPAKANGRALTSTRRIIRREIK